MKFPNRMPDFTPNPKHERPRGALEIWSEANWAKIPELIRTDVEQHLKQKLPLEVLTRWQDQHRRGMRIGSDDPFFHLGVGIAVRNACREQLTDLELPSVTVDHEGKPYNCSTLPNAGAGGNWDDYYFGVLAAIAA
jgi:hypothetical protein